MGAEIVHASYLPKGPRREACRWLAVQVRELEVTATTLCRAATVPGARSAEASVALHRDVARLEAAQQELDDLFPPVVFDRPGKVGRPVAAMAGDPYAVPLEPPSSWPPPGVTQPAETLHLDR
jgi:hypothetical protein